jgi:hypothetical protein
MDDGSDHDCSISAEHSSQEETNSKTKQSFVISKNETKDVNRLKLFAILVLALSSLIMAFSVSNQVFLGCKSLIHVTSDEKALCSLD